MNRTLAVASALAAITAFIHIFMGSRGVVDPLLASTLETWPKLVLHAVWHMGSAALILSAVALFVGGLPRHAEASRYLVWFISVSWCCFAGVFLAIIALQPESGWLFKLPQWTLLLPVGLLGLWASARTTKST
ncbi:conserved hypothetical protein [Rhodopseudomonas palustris HaA2]|uniref:DUF423 domain-containing protein n=1 Tax=Rhodopseudomonas palustris (strain HaA2) TaxID=316058 RepID=Q2IWE4_RHOP2|nr:hypothetical protein [Rhodopseudomonas palustris]ABD07466.1 conserved hypothetical protein [Rhodopseudomonas palustris HaA2]